MWPWCCDECRTRFEHLCSRMRQGLPLTSKEPKRAKLPRAISRDEQRENEAFQRLPFDSPKWNDSRTR